MRGLFCLAVCARSETGLVRRANQDAVLAQHELGMGVFAVADGVSTTPGAEEASLRAVEAMRELAHDTGESQLAGHIQTLHQQLQSRGSAINPVRGMGTTLDVLLVSRRRATWAHVGDSFIAVADGGAPFRVLTENHHRISDGREYLENYLGQPGPLRIDTGQLDLRLGQRWLLASDGLTKHLSLLEIGQLSEAQPEPSAWAAALLETCLSRGGFDNLSVVCIELRPTSAPLHRTRSL